MIAVVYNFFEKKNEGMDGWKREGKGKSSFSRDVGEGEVTISFLSLFCLVRVIIIALIQLILLSLLRKVV